MPTDPEPILLYDGDCGLCARSVSFVLEHEAAQVLRFAPMSGPTARALIAQAVSPVGDSVLLYEGGRLHQRSAAVWRLARHLRWPWRAVLLLAVIPAPLRDLAYDAVARRRHRWFGPPACRRLRPEHRRRFLDLEVGSDDAG